MYLFEYSAAARWKQDANILKGWLAEYTPSEQRRISELCSVLPAEHQPTAREAVARALANAKYNTEIAEAVAAGVPVLCYVKAPGDVVIGVLLSGNPVAVDLDMYGEPVLAFVVGSSAR
jgi:hypothetical protein